ncbi:MAG: UDP-N-acetylmuramate--L-alanine ligase [Pseudoflavonifractor sp.]|nr:UDP-N-acetylmuramate--L-alanine ligase [Alloprevotella sp.]MCM1117428.1 UDP-N-acetylmuramate--L-alanine ligase [Pseudoflavonifractor sp.]
MNHHFPKNIYFVGAGGIGMAALERFFLSRGCQVAGYDRTPTELTSALISEGVEMTFDDDPELIPRQMRTPDDTLVVYTPAIPPSHRGLKWFRDKGFRVVKRAEVLGIATADEKAICFSGTHGKTTTSSMAAHMLHSGPYGCNAFLGGVLRNYSTNFLLSPTSPYAVVEADEYDRSFYHLRPYVAVVTATDPDHLDIYGTEEAYLEAFAHFTELIRPGGALLLHTGLKLRPRPGKDVRVMTYSPAEGDFHAENIRHAEGTITFDLVTPSGLLRDITPGVPVEINIDNAIAALGALWLAGCLEPDSARAAMASFMGPKRRFEFHLRQDGRAIIDDYAHHPDELAASISSVKALYPGKKLTVAFQPHLFSRTRDFAPAFARALSAADEVILLPIYPAREEPIEGVTSQIILDKVTSPSKILLADKKDLPEEIKKRNFEILLTAGAGDIVDLLPRITADALGNNA